MSETYEPRGVQFFDAASNRLMMLVCHPYDQYDGWILWRHPDGQWVTVRKATNDDRDRIAQAAGGQARCVPRTHAVQPEATPPGATAPVDPRQRKADAVASEAAAPPEETDRAEGMASQVRAVLADVKKVIAWRKEAGADDCAVADFDTIATWLTLALAGRYRSSRPFPVR